MEPGVTNKTSWYLAKFPLGKIPGCESRDGAFTLVESNAIAQYLAERGPKKQQLLGATAEERALVSQWIFFFVLLFVLFFVSLVVLLFLGRRADLAGAPGRGAQPGRHHRGRNLMGRLPRLRRRRDAASVPGAAGFLRARQSHPGLSVSILGRHGGEEARSGPVVVKTGAGLFFFF